MTQALDQAPARKIRETGGPTILSFAGIPDGYLLKRVSAAVQGVDPASLGSVVTFYTGSVDPSAGGGVAASIPSIYVRNDGVVWSKTGAGDTDWTRIVTSTLVTIQTITVAVDTDSVVFSGLNVDVDGTYYLQGKILSGHSGDGIFLRPNSIADTNMKCGFFINLGSSLSVFTIAGMALTALSTAGSVSTIDADFMGSKIDGLPRAGHSSSMIGIGGVDQQFEGDYRWNDGSTNITSLQIRSNGGTGAGIKAGSILTLSKFAG
jgi:hypothetical protein